MDRQELKAKIMKGFTIALPILLVAILAMLVVVAMKLSDPQFLPTIGGVDDGTTTTTTTGNEEPDPEPDPSSKGLSFVSNGDGTCSLDGIGECEDSFIIVPMESPDGDIVTEIANNAFKNCSSIKGIELCETVISIGAYAFYGSAIRDIEIPSTVREIGNYAFAGCKYLTEISVIPSNPNYSSLSGVLYSKEGDVLITYPAGKTENSVIIGREVTEIANMAFYKCSYIKKVTYHGTERSWRAIEIGAGNDVIDEAIIYYSGDYSSDK